MPTRIATGDARRKLQSIPNESVNCSMFSPPYWLVRDYRGGAAEIGRERMFRQYIENLLGVIDEIERVLMPNGTLFLNLGDSFITQAGTSRGPATYYPETGTLRNLTNGELHIKSRELPHKSLCLIPYRVAIAMQDRGWIVRNVIIWHKPNSMPESVQDRFTVDFEPVFFCTKNPKYYFSQQFRPYARNSMGRSGTPSKPTPQRGANQRCVWTIPTARRQGSHFAVFPEQLVEICIQAGCPPGGVVLDPFLGSGTVAVVAERLGRNCIGIELNPEFAQLAKERIMTARVVRVTSAGQTS